MAKPAKKALLAAVYAAGVLAFFEGSARLALSERALFRKVAGEDDATWRLRWVKRHEKSGTIYYSFDVHSPTRGWALRPSIQDMPVFHGKVLNSNSRGIRGRKEHAYEKPPGAVRILVFGDSYAFGEDVSDDETFSHGLEEMLPGVEVLNMAVHGYGHDQMLVYLREEGVKYHPDAVVLGFTSLDVDRNLRGFRDYAKPRFVLEAGRLALRGTPVPTPEETMAAEARRSRFADLLTMLYERYRRRSGAAQREARELTLAILDAMAETIRSLGAKPAFAYLPVYGEINKPDLAMTEEERFFFGYCRQRGIESMYLRPFFLRKMGQGVVLKAHGHWSPLEHQTAAEGIKALLLEKDLIRLPAPLVARPPPPR